mmetsp:Transcript_868/g.1815  ORF Transcript_868/g.1815 Transcript_868/m.1815 type:complete len:260 (+) Transcript_868:150-929(+)
MKIAIGTIASLVLTVGAVLVLVMVNSSDNVINSGSRPPKTSFLRSGSSRKLYNYSRDNSNSGNYNGYNGAYGGSYGGNYGNSDNSGNYGDYGGDDGNGGNYGDNGGNYGNGGNNNDDNNNGDDGLDYANYGNDDGSYYNSNKNYQADASSYNGRDQQWGGQSVQTYTDDEEPTVEVETYQEDDRWEILGKFGGLSGAETVAVAGLAAVLSISVLCFMMMLSGINIIDLCQLYCCSSIFGHKDEKARESIEEGFVKLGDY